MKISNRHIAIIALIISNIVWGAASPIFKWSLQDIPPFTLAFFRFFIASLLLWPFIIPHISLRPTDIPKIVLLAFTGLIINISFFFLGLQLTSSIDTTIIGASAPILLMLIAFFYLREKPRKKVIIGTLLSLLGIICIILRPLLEIGNTGSNILGNLFIIISTLAVVMYTILLKRFNLPYGSLVLVFWLFFAASIMFFPLFLWEVQTINLLDHLSTRSIVGILYGAVSSSTLAYLCYDLGVRYLKANEVGIFFYLDPIITVVVAMPLLGEKITLLYIIGSLMVFAGIYIAEGRIHHNHRTLVKKA